MAPETAYERLYQNWSSARCLLQADWPGLKVGSTKGPRSLELRKRYRRSRRLAVSLSPHGSSLLSDSLSSSKARFVKSAQPIEKMSFIFFQRLNERHRALRKRAGFLTSSARILAHKCYISSSDTRLARAEWIDPIVIHFPDSGRGGGFHAERNCDPVDAGNKQKCSPLSAHVSSVRRVKPEKRITNG